MCVEKFLIIELDGGQHIEGVNIDYDNIRTEYLEQHGYKVLRFWKNDVWYRFEEVIDMIFVTNYVIFFFIKLRIILF